MTDAFTVLDEMKNGFEAVTEADVLRAQRQLTKPASNERVLGTVHNLDARKMWALSVTFEAQQAKYLLDGKFTANSEDEIEEAHRKSHRANCFAELARDMFWAQAKEDIGGSAWCGGIALRAGWQIVESPETPVTPIVAKLLGL